MIFEQLDTYGHEQVVYCHNKDAGLKAIIAIHNTVLGPALGGTRMWPYKTEADALEELLAAKGTRLDAVIAMDVDDDALVRTRNLRAAIESARDFATGGDGTGPWKKLVEERRAKASVSVE